MDEYFELVVSCRPAVVVPDRYRYRHRYRWFRWSVLQYILQYILEYKSSPMSKSKTRTRVHGQTEAES